MNSRSGKPRMTKGDRKGWPKKSQYTAVPVNTVKWDSVKVEFYAHNRYGLPKLIP